MTGEGKINNYSSMCSLKLNFSKTS